MSNNQKNTTSLNSTRFFLYNSLTRKSEQVEVLNSPKLKIYACGPTVYSYAHIGNFRSFLTADLIVRVAKSLGYTVSFVSNITDVGHLSEDDIADASGEDKIERALRGDGGVTFSNIWDLARYFSSSVIEDWQTLGLTEPNVRPRATEHVANQIEMISELLKKGYAYETKQGVYFDIVRFPDYGKLSGNSLNALMTGSREIVVDSEKKNVHDFALWKKSTTHLMRWHSPFGWGYPGWHIECSAMARQYLGDTLDIHCGGEDNRFPHHECEIAQSEATTGKQLSRHWVHTAHLLVDGKRMAKSAGNFYTIRDVLSRGIEPQALRYALTCSRYREKLNYTEASLQSAITVVDRIKNVYSKIQLSAGDAVGDDTLVPSKIIDHYDKCFAALLDDLNTPVAFAELLAAVKAITQLIPTIEAEQAAAILKILKKFHGLLGIGAWDQKPKEAIAQRDDKLDAWIQDRIKERDDAKNRRDYVLADKIRDELHVRGIALIDTKDGTLFKRANVPAPC